MPCRDPHESMEDDASRERRHMLVRCLCHVCHHLEATDRHDVIAADPELSAFWAEHQAADARRDAMSKKERAALDNPGASELGIRNSAVRKLRYTLTPKELRVLRKGRGWPWRLLPDSLDGIDSAL